MPTTLVPIPDAGGGKKLVDMLTPLPDRVYFLNGSVYKEVSFTIVSYGEVKNSHNVGKHVVPLDKLG